MTIKEELENIQTTVMKSKSPYKCGIHNAWMKHGKCEPCLMELDRKRREQDAENGVVRQKIKIGKL